MKKLTKILLFTGAASAAVLAGMHIHREIREFLDEEPSCEEDDPEEWYDEDLDEGLDEEQEEEGEAAR